jgi:integrase
MRRGERLGLKWEDIDFSQNRVAVRRAFVRGQLTTPKNGKGRQIAILPGLGSALLVLAIMRKRRKLNTSPAGSNADSRRKSRHRASLTSATTFHHIMSACLL